MNASVRRRGLLAVVMFVLLLVPLACTGPGYGGAATGAPAANPAGAPTVAPTADPAASPAKGKYGY